MMDYEIFKEVVAEKFPSYLPGEYKGREIVVTPMDRVNQTKDGIILKLDGISEKVSPTIYIDDMYQQYLQNENLQQTLENAAHAMYQAIEQGISAVQKLDLDNPKEKIVFQLINTEQNRQMLEGMPHREWKDLSIIYRMVADVDEKGISSVMIHDGLADKFGLTEEQLFKLAVENTKRIFPPTVRSMNDIMRDVNILEYIDKYSKVTKEDVKKALDKYFNMEYEATSIVNPKG